MVRPARKQQSLSLEPASLGAALRQMRLRAGLSQAALAERAELSPAAIGALELGQRLHPHPHTLQRLAEALGLQAYEHARLVELASPHHSANADLSGPPASAVRPLPEPPTPLIGRDDEVREAMALLQASRPVRLLTLLGPGGVGKTRLALAIAAAVQSTALEVAFVDLAPVRDERLVAATAAWTLGLHDAGGRSASELLVTHLQQQQGLVVFDNFEHLLGAASLVAELLAACPSLRVLVTSRSALNLRAERRFVVEPLAAPSSDRPLSLASMADFSAVQLFVDRAQAVTPAFRLTHSNVESVAALCRRLEGVPLSLELAAARLSVLEPGTLLERLEQRLVVLDGGPSDLPERQRTLRATLAWSHALLGSPEQVLFRRLAVFAGGWTLEAAEAVCAAADLPENAVFERLGMLVDNSLVQRSIGADGRPRFGMLETVREFADERLIESGEAELMRTRQLTYYSELAEIAAPWLHTAEQITWLNRLEAEHDNFRIVLSGPAMPSNAAEHLQLATALRYFWYIRGYHREGRDRLLATLALPATAMPTLARARALNAVGFLEIMQGHVTAASPFFEEALRIGRAVGDVTTQAFALRYLGAVANAAGAYDEARTALEESVAQWSTLDAPAELALAQMYLADVAISLGDDGWATQLLAASVTLQRALNNTNALGYPLRRLGYLALRRGDCTNAVRLCIESLTLNAEIGDRQGVAASLVGLADVCYTRGERRHAARLLGAADALLASVNTQLLPVDRQRQADLTIQLGAEIGEAEFAGARAQGRALSIEQAIALA